MLPNKSATHKPPNYLGPDSLICFEPYSLKTLVYWRMNLPCSFVPWMWRSKKSQVLKLGYILFLVPEGWLSVWVILTFLPEWRSWRRHERFSVICTLLAHLSGSLTSQGLLLYWGAEPSPQASAPQGACAWAWTQLYIKAMLQHCDSLHALPGCNAGSPDTGDSVLIQKRLAVKLAGTYNTIEGAGPIHTTTRISRRELDKIKALFRSPETFVSVRPPSGWNLWLGNKVECQRDLEPQLTGSGSLLKAGLWALFQCGNNPE